MKTRFSPARCCCGCRHCILVRYGCPQGGFAFPAISGAKVELLDAAGTVLAEYTTGVDGIACYDPPEGLAKVRASKTGLQPLVFDPPGCGETRTAWLRPGDIRLVYEGCGRGAPYPVSTWLVERLDSAGTVIQSWTLETDPATGRHNFEPPPYEDFFHADGSTYGTTIRFTANAPHAKENVRTITLTTTNYCSGLTIALSPNFNGGAGWEDGWGCGCSGFRSSSHPHNRIMYLTSPFGTWAVDMQAGGFNTCSGSACHEEELDHVVATNWSPTTGVCRNPPAGPNLTYNRNIDPADIGLQTALVALTASPTWNQFNGAASATGAVSGPKIESLAYRETLSPTGSPSPVTCVIDGSDDYLRAYRRAYQCSDVGVNSQSWPATSYVIHSRNPIVVEFLVEVPPGDNWGPVRASAGAREGEPPCASFILSEV